MSIEKEIIIEKLKKYGKRETKRSGLENAVSGNIAGMETNVAAVRENLAALKNNEINTSARFIERGPGIRGKLSWFVKKVVRRLSFFYVQPICNQQTVYNTAATQCVENLLELDLYFSHKLLDFQNEKQFMQEQLQTEMTNLKAEMRQLQVENTDLQAENTNLQSEMALLNDKTDQYLANMKILEETGVCQFENNAYLPQKSYAQSGEDLIIFHILIELGIDLRKVTYLDLGAYRAKELSNTYALYKKGARGVLLEANPAFIAELKLNRNEDIILNKCLTLQSGGSVLFYVLNGDGLSTANRKMVDKVLAKNPNLTIEKEVEVQTITVNELLEQYFIQAPTVLNIDLEGMEYDVLSHIDFKNIRPLIVIVEMIEYNTTINAGEKNQKIFRLMEQNNYIEYAFTGINSIFVDASVWKK